MASTAPDSGPPSRPPISRRTRWAILGLGLTQIIGYGTTYYLLGLLGGLMMQDLGLSKTALLSGVSLLLLVSALLGPMVGRWQDRAGSRLPMTLGSLAMGCGLLLLSMAKGPILYFLGWTMIAVGAPASLYSACFTALAQMAGRSARYAIVLLTLIGGLASSIVWPVTALLLDMLDWRSIVLLFAGLNILICAPLHAGLLDGERHIRAEAASPPENVPPGLSVAAQPRAFLLLTSMLTTISIVGNAWSMLVFPVLLGLGYDFGLAVLVASLVGVFQVLGRIGELAAGGRHSPLRSSEISNYLFLLAFVALIMSEGGYGIGVLFAAAYGIANGLNTIAKGALTLAIFGSAGYGERLGKVTLMPGLGAAAGPILGGFAIETLGVHGLLAAFCGLSALTTVLMLLLSRHCRRNGLA